MGDREDKLDRLYQQAHTDIKNMHFMKDANVYQYGNKLEEQVLNRLRELDGSAEPSTDTRSALARGTVKTLQDPRFSEDMNFQMEGFKVKPWEQMQQGQQPQQPPM